MHDPPVRRAHVTVAARFDCSPSATWSRFVDFADGHVGPDGATELLAPGTSRWIRRLPGDLGVVEERSRTEDGVVAYRARVPGGSAVDDVDGVVRVSQEAEGSLVTWTTEAVTAPSASERERVRQWLADRLRTAGGTVLAPLTMDVWLGGYRDVARTGLDGTGTATWSPTTATLVSGEHDAVLVDALMTADEADALVEWIRGSGKRLRTVVVTQGQADHFFGLGRVLRAFPDAVATAVADVATRALDQTAPAHRSRWESLFPGRLPGSLTAPTPDPAGVVDLEGHALQLFDVGRIGDRPTSLVSVRHLDAVIGGDLVYNRVHPWLVGTDADSRRSWARALDLVEALRPAWVIASHRHPASRSDAARPQVAALRRYLGDVETVLADHGDAGGFVREMLRRWPRFGNRSTLEASAVALYTMGPPPSEADLPDLLPRRPQEEADEPTDLV
ncbi:glyoxylase-like metal-dependent hydrolase (beta-lactamase superfamily II) [Curtobacterium sp. 320]|uniref:MBL fold metallo-hydrolase n=1 Tax=Curtobacterium sp. 320 TaxID=2817749 RepID=UPI00285735F4|nr:MBL fold metallo-hydrolase [Curtobacterium sp. 320]MDR6574802.1 glyoxylase-like metal-dependent hydrolase (beta-lactamase superfamily II) [Curtobacterium sp. 320]